MHVLLALHFTLATLGIQVDDIDSKVPPRENTATAHAAQLISLVIFSERLKAIITALWAAY